MDVRAAAHRRVHPRHGWAAIVATVVIADALGSRPMSEAFREATRHPVAGPFVVAAWCTVTAHLFGAIPPRYDPIHRIACPVLMKPCSHAW